MQISDEKLIKLHLEGDEKAFPELIERYKNAIFRFALSFCKKYEDAEDIAQITFVKVYEHLPKSKIHLSFKPWIFTICANLCKNLARKKTSLTFSQLEYTNAEGETQSIINTIEDKTENIQDKIYKKQIKDPVKKAIEDLPNKYKLVITLRYFDNLSYNEISEILTLPVNTIKTHIKRAKKKLETSLQHII